MPYILVRGSLEPWSGCKTPKVLVSGLKTADIQQLSSFPRCPYGDDATLAYLSHPCVILSALEVLGYKVVTSTSAKVYQDKTEYMWTMRKDFSEPEPELVTYSD